MSQLSLSPNLSGALFSPCKAYRYRLWRGWNTEKPAIMFIGLNPSKATEDSNDPTIRRVIGFAKSWGYGTLYMLNLFPFITPYPECLETGNSYHNRTNDLAILQTAKQVEKVVLAWGAFKAAIGRDKEVIAMFPDAYCLGKTKSGAPLHPLFVPGKTQLIRYA